MIFSANWGLVLLTAHFQFSLVDWLDGVSDDVYFLGHVIDLTFDVLFCHSSPFLVFTLKGLEEHRLSVSGEDRKSRLSTSRAWERRTGQETPYPPLSSHGQNPARRGSACHPPYLLIVTTGWEPVTGYADSFSWSFQHGAIYLVAGYIAWQLWWLKRLTW